MEHSVSRNSWNKKITRLLPYSCSRNKKINHFLLYSVPGNRFHGTFYFLEQENNLHFAISLFLGTGFMEYSVPVTSQNKKINHFLPSSVPGNRSHGTFCFSEQENNAPFALFCSRDQAEQENKPFFAIFCSWEQPIPRFHGTFCS